MELKHARSYVRRLIVLSAFQQKVFKFVHGDIRKAIENESLKVQVYIDKSNSDGTHYLGIEVMDLNKTGVVSFRGAKGSLKDMVQFSDSATSMVSCLPTAE